MNRINDNLDNTLTEITNVMKSLYIIQKKVDESDICQNTKLQTIRNVLIQAESKLNDTITTIDEKLFLENKLRKRRIREGRRSFAIVEDGSRSRSFVTNSEDLTLEDYDDNFIEY
jgi:hypothetical protein